MYAKIQSVIARGAAPAAVAVKRTGAAGGAARGELFA